MSAALDASAFDEAIRAHDAAVAARGLVVWVGGEPTFTLRASSAPAWQGQAQGDDKEARARVLCGALAAATPGAFVVRSVGRQYPGEDRPRWCYGLYKSRLGEALWSGPPDPLLVRSGPHAQEAPAPLEHPVAGSPTSARTSEPTSVTGGLQATAVLAHSTASSGRASALRDALAALLRRGGHATRAFDVDLALDPERAFDPDCPFDPNSAFDPAGGVGASALARAPDPSAFAWRVVYRPAHGAGAGAGDRADAALPDARSDPRLARPPVHAAPSPEAGLRDDLARDGLYLVCVGAVLDGTLAVELPRLADVATYLELLGVIAEAARALDLRALVLQGYPPPVDPSTSWATITPDPGVIEVNMAPVASVGCYLEATRAIHEAARAAGLFAERLQWNGEARDSGGGGHLTFGGPSIAESPFARTPCLLPALVAYVNRHPSLSYLFAVASVGSSSQAPRADEGARELVGELDLELRRLARAGDGLELAAVWEALQPFLADRSGNAHRAEINAEKLWSPDPESLRRLGVVELRALAMPPTPEEAAALAALFRAVVVSLAPRAAEVAAQGLVDWGADLHDRFALPYFLEQDLAVVLEDLDRAGLGLAEPLRAALGRALERRFAGALDLGDGARLVVRRALEFWPLVGDVASQERGTARWLDASTERLELCVWPAAGASAAAEPDARWALAVEGFAVPLVRVDDARGRAWLRAVRYRAFEPRAGLHPGLARTDPVVLHLRAPGAAERWRVAVHGWRPDGGAYERLPVDASEARARRAARFVVTREPCDPAAPIGVEAPPHAFTAWTFDLRRAR